ncbi:MAG: division/cell wall cluster transcriptional repressor MraZ [Chloroflexi bacterium]|nr:division/cell wall cluster transcriptional repressor MraZ [Chloroflexota bacterium]
MFIGHYQSSFKETSQVEIPAIFRETLMGQVVVTQGFDRNLLVLPVDVFQDLSRLVVALNIANPLARSLMRILLGNASYVQIDQSGSINVPAALKEFAGLVDGVVLVGQGKYFEVWSQAGWQRQELDLQDAEVNSTRFTSLNLAGM